MPLWTDLLSKIAKGVERASRETFRIQTGQEYSPPRALFGVSEFISALTSQGKTPWEDSWDFSSDKILLNSLFSPSISFSVKASFSSWRDLALEFEFDFRVIIKILLKISLLVSAELNNARLHSTRTRATCAKLFSWVKEKGARALHSFHRSLRAHHFFVFLLFY